MHLDNVPPPAAITHTFTIPDARVNAITLKPGAEVITAPIISWPRYGSFGDALQAMREFKRVRRAGWNGKGMSLGIAIGGKGYTTAAYGRDVDLSPYIVMETANGDFVPWLASQTDILAYDWEVL